jgi:hypothetical protein
MAKTCIARDFARYPISVRGIDLATSTNIVEFSTSHRVRTRFGSETAAGTFDASHKKPPETVTTIGTPADEALDLTIAEKTKSSGVGLSQSDLYPARQAFSREHITALRLLTIATGRSKRALDELAANNVLAADAEIQKIQVLLPELFCCRTLGDGFGTIVNAFMSAFETLAGNTPDVPQIRKMNQVFQLLKERPFLSADEADEQIEKLESVGLNPYPIELLEFLSSEQGATQDEPSLR